MDRLPKFPYILLRPFTQDYGQDVTSFQRREFFNCFAVLKETAFSPYAYIITVLLILAISCTMPSMNVPLIITAAITITAAISITGLISIVFMKSTLIFHPRFNGLVYPSKVMSTRKGTYILAIDTSMTPPEVVGTIAVQPETEYNELWVILYCVKSGYRGMGIGTHLLLSALEHCKNVNVYTVKAHCWQCYSLQPICKFFERFGFKKFKQDYLPDNFPVYRAWQLERTDTRVSSGQSLMYN